MELSNGCICCTMRGDLLREVTRLARGGAFDYLLIESTGVSEPMQVPLMPLVPSHPLSLCHLSSAPCHPAGNASLIHSVTLPGISHLSSELLVLVDHVYLSRASSPFVRWGMPSAALACVMDIFLGTSACWHLYRPVTFCRSSNSREVRASTATVCHCDWL